VARFVKGDVVVVPFPFSNLQEAKRRPALVVSPLDGDDLILCLKQSSNIRPNRLFTADRAIVLYRAGSLASRKVEEVVDRLVQSVRG
jgi:mRNA interferase MazF